MSHPLGRQGRSWILECQLNTRLNKFSQMQQMIKKMGKFQEMVGRMGGGGLPGMLRR